MVGRAVNHAFGTDDAMMGLLGSPVTQQAIGKQGLLGYPQYMVDGWQQIPGILSPGNIDIANRPIVKNKDGTISTVRSIGINYDGKEYLIPTVSMDGKIMTNKQAIDTFIKTKKHLGIFSNPKASHAYAQILHNQQAQMYSK